MADPQTTPNAILRKLAEEEDRFERIAGDLPGNAYARGCADGAHWQTAAIKGLIVKSSEDTPERLTMHTPSCISNTSAADCNCGYDEQVAGRT